MAEVTGIEWTHHTHNLWWGCTKVDEECDNCYAERDSKRYGFNVWGPGAPRRVFKEAHYLEPLKWEKKAVAAGEHRRVFCSSMADICDVDAPDGIVAKWLWPIIRETPHLHWLLLTKRPARFPLILPPDWGAGYPNVMLMTSVGQQKSVHRARQLLAVPALQRGLSCEPLLTGLDLTGLVGQGSNCTNCGSNVRVDEDGCCISCGTDAMWYGVDWVIAGGESGPKARPTHPDWLRALRDVSVAAGVPYFFKQFGEWLPVSRMPSGEATSPESGRRPLARYSTDASGRRCRHSPQRHGALNVTPTGRAPKKGKR